MKDSILIIKYQSVMKPLTEKDFLKFQWRDIAITEHQNERGKHILCIICDSMEESKYFLNLMANNPFKIGIKVEPITNYYILEILFDDATAAPVFNTHRTVQSYDKLKLLVEGKVKYISGGILRGITASGENNYVCDGLLPLSMPALN